MRPRVPIPFGGGVDRTSGVMVVEPAAFSDLRNVHLRGGKAEMRRGITSALQAAGETHLLGIFPIRSQGIGAAITMRASDGRVSLYQITGAGTEASLIGTVWTLGAAAAVPSIKAADSYDKLIIAHNQVALALRKVTRVYDVLAGTIADLTADLDRDSTANAVKFRGVRRYLNYLVGWGYGTDSDEDRPELVRVSKPGAPTEFEPEHYFLAGQRGDPVIDCSPAGNVLAVRKMSESYDIFGYDRSTFGIRPADLLYGQAGARLSVTVGATNYFWSLEGPRLSQGGATRDIALPLDLEGPAPDALAATLDLDAGFAEYLPGRREILFVFGAWCYVLHIENPDALRWSFRKLGVAPICGGVLYEAVAGASGPQLTSVTKGAVTTDHNSITVPYTCVGTLLGGETIELWGKSNQAGFNDTWIKLASQSLTGLTGSIVALSSYPTTPVWSGVLYDIAIRVKRNGVSNTGSGSADPAVWPAAQRGTAQVALDAPFLDTAANLGVVWFRLSGTQESIRFSTDSQFPIGSPAALGVQESYATWEFQISTDGGGTWTAAAAVSRTPFDPPYTANSGVPLQSVQGYCSANTYGETTIQVRVRQSTAWLTSGWSTGRAIWVGPIKSAAADVLITATGTPGTYKVRGPINYLFLDYPNTSNSFGSKVAAQLDALGWSADVDAPDPGLTGIPEANVTRACGTGAAAAYGRARVYAVQYGVTDFSDWTVGAVSIAPTC